MKKNLLILICFLANAIPTQSRGGDLPAGLPPLPPPTPGPQTKNSIYVQFGSAYSNNYTADQVGFGYGIGLSRNFSLLIDTHYTHLSPYTFNILGPESSIVTYTAGLQSWTLLCNGKLNITDRDSPVVFFGITGLGFALLFRDAFQNDSQYYPESSDLSPAIRLGFGFDIRLAKGLALTLEENVVLPFYSSLFPGQQNETGIASYGSTSIGLKLDE